MLKRYGVRLGSLRPVNKRGCRRLIRIWTRPARLDERRFDNNTDWLCTGRLGPRSLDHMDIFFAQRSGVKMSRDLINLMAVLELVFVNGKCNAELEHAGLQLSGCSGERVWVKEERALISGSAAGEPPFDAAGGSALLCQESG